MTGPELPAVMCNHIAYVMAAATGTRKESERDAEWKDDADTATAETGEEEREEPEPAAA